MSSLTNFLQPDKYIVSGASALYAGQLKDLANQTIGSASISALTLSLFDEAGAVVNSVNEINILNTGRGSLDTAGNLTITLQPNDTDIGAVTYEVRTLVFAYTYGSDVGRHVVKFGIIGTPGAV